MVKYWMHNGLMRAADDAGKVGGRSDRATPATDSQPAPQASSPGDASGKISRSKGAGGLAQLIAKHTGERIRFFLLRSHYRSTSVFGDEPLAEAGSALETFYRLFARAEKILGYSFYSIPYKTRRDQAKPAQANDKLLIEVAQLRESFLSKMDDDFNTGGATADLFEIARAINRFIDQNQLETSPSQSAKRELHDALSILRELAALLGIFRKPLPASQSIQDSGKVVEGLMQLVLKLRMEARARRDFATSDAVRDGLKEIGILLQDGKQGTTWEIQK